LPASRANRMMLAMHKPPAKRLVIPRTLSVALVAAAVGAAAGACESESEPESHTFCIEDVPVDGGPNDVDCTKKKPSGACPEGCIAIS
jgi:hypothetical protein